MDHLQLQLRPCRPSDDEFVFHVRKLAFRKYLELTYGPWDETTQRFMHMQGFRPQDTQIISLGGRDVGWIEIHDRPADLYLANIYLLPEAQGHGIGRQLINQLIQRGRDERRPVTLRVLKVNPARRLYERLGFKHDYQIETHYYMRWDTDTDAGTDARLT